MLLIQYFSLQATILLHALTSNEMVAQRDTERVYNMLCIQLYLSVPALFSLNDFYTIFFHVKRIIK